LSLVGHEVLFGKRLFIIGAPSLLRFIAAVVNVESVAAVVMGFGAGVLEMINLRGG
jgi:hypothetical protein